MPNNTLGWHPSKTQRHRAPPKLQVLRISVLLAQQWFGSRWQVRRKCQSSCQWCSGNINAFQAFALGSIPGWCNISSTFRTFLFPQKKRLRCLRHFQKLWVSIILRSTINARILSSVLDGTLVVGVIITTSLYNILMLCMRGTCTLLS